MNFYLLNDPENLPDRKFATWSDETHFEGVKCPKHDGHRRAGNRITPLYINLPNNKDDIIWSWYSDCLINEKVIHLLATSAVTGYKLEDIHIVQDKRKESRNKLFNLVPTGQGGHIDPSSGYKILETCEYCGHKKVKHYETGLLVDEKQWDKSDIFTLIEYPKYILVTPKVKEIFEENQITGCQFYPADTFKTKY